MLAGLLGLLPTTAFAETWRFASLEWQPYSGQSLPGGGSSIYLLRRALASIGVELDVEFLPWERAQRYTKEFPHTYVGYFPAWPSEVDNGFIGASNHADLVPIISSPIGVASLDGKLSWQSLKENPTQHSLCLVKSYVYPKDISNYAHTVENLDQTAINDVQLLRMLVAKRCDAGIVDQYVMASILSSDAHLNRTLKTRQQRAALKMHTEIIATIPLVPAFLDTPQNRNKRDRLREAIYAIDTQVLLSQYQACMKTQHPELCLTHN